MIDSLNVSSILGLLVTPSVFTIVDDIEYFVALALAMVTANENVMELVQRVVPQKGAVGG